MFSSDFWHLASSADIQRKSDIPLRIGNADERETEKKSEDQCCDKMVHSPTSEISVTNIQPEAVQQVSPPEASQQASANSNDSAAALLRNRIDSLYTAVKAAGTSISPNSRQYFPRRALDSPQMFFDSLGSVGFTLAEHIWSEKALRSSRRQLQESSSDDDLAREEQARSLHAPKCVRSLLDTIHTLSEAELQIVDVPGWLDSLDYDRMRKVQKFFAVRIDGKEGILRTVFSLGLDRWLRCAIPASQQELLILPLLRLLATEESTGTVCALMAAESSYYDVLRQLIIPTKETEQWILQLPQQMNSRTSMISSGKMVVPLCTGLWNAMPIAFDAKIYPAARQFCNTLQTHRAKLAQTSAGDDE